MVNWAKKIEKSCGTQLHPGEHIEAGTFVQPAGVLARQVGVGTGGLVGALIAEKVTSRRTDAVASDGGLAAQFPTGRLVLGLSAGRLLAFSHGTVSGKPKDLIAAVGLRDIDTISAARKKISYEVQISFRDGTAVSYEAVKTAKPEEFIATFERLHG